MFKLVCTHPFNHREHGPHERGQVVLDQDKVAALGKSHENHFVRVRMTLDEENKAKAANK